MPIYLRKSYAFPAACNMLCGSAASRSDQMNLAVGFNPRKGCCKIIPVASLTGEFRGLPETTIFSLRFQKSSIENDFIYGLFSRRIGSSSRVKPNRFTSSI